MKKEDSRDSLIDIPLEDDRDESQLTGRKAAEYNKQHVIRHKKRVRTKILCALGILLAPVSYTHLTLPTTPYV